MTRRDFLQTSLPAGVAGACLASGVASADSPAPAGDARKCYEWRTYRFDQSLRPVAGVKRVFETRSKEYYEKKHALVHDYLKSAALPAWTRLGLGPVGVFTEIGENAGPSIHVLIVYPTALTVTTARETMERDPECQKAAAGYLAAKKEDPAFERIESWLLLAFRGAPKITPPSGKPRAYELRTYQNHGEDRARAKVEMFNDGEITIFPECGFQNVFFGEALIGSGLPCLKYMLATPDLDANKAAWAKFIVHPKFVKMKNDPKYADTEPNIVKQYLQPTEYSQV
jgi:hypothetical protein